MSDKGIHFNISERKILLRIFDLLFVLLALYLTGLWFEFNYFQFDPINVSSIIVLALYIMVFGTVFELYDLQKASKWDSVIYNSLLTATTTVVLYLFTPFYTPFLPEKRVQILLFFVAIFLGLCLWRFFYINFISTPRFFKNVLIVGEISNIQTVIEAFRNSDPHYNVMGFINCESRRHDGFRFKGVTEYKPEEMLAIIAEKRISEVVVASYNSENITSELYHDLMSLLEAGFPIREYTQVYEEMTYRVPVQFVGKDFYKYFPFSRSNKNKLYLLYRWLFDVVFSIIGLVICAIFLPLILLGNALANKGPLFYSQERVGKNGKVFPILKFRTMVKNAETHGAVWASKNDARITPFGKFLRLTRLDELPQFYNILKGDMSLIGPRPERPYFVQELSQVIPFYETRHIIKPGLTGWAQVKVRYGSSVDDSLLKLQYDLYYIKHRSFFLDANILVKTLSTVIFFRGQ